MTSAKATTTRWLVLTKQKLTKSSGNMVPPSKPQRYSWADFRKQLPVALIVGVLGVHMVTYVYVRVRIGTVVEEGVEVVRVCMGNCSHNDTTRLV